MEAFNRISTWSAAGEPQLMVASGVAVALCFVVFSAMRVLLYLPQLLRCWRDPHGCGDQPLDLEQLDRRQHLDQPSHVDVPARPLGPRAEPGSATMCGVIVVVILVKRRRYRAPRAVRSHGRPAAEPRFIDVRVLPAVGSRHALASVSGPHHFSMYGRRSSSHVQASRGWTCRLQ